MMKHKGLIISLVIIMVAMVGALAWAGFGDAELKFRYGITATAEQINALSGTTVTATEVEYLSGVTSNIQTQFSGKLTTSLADGKIWIGNNVGGLAIAVTPSGDATITNAGVISLAAGSVNTAELVVNAVTNAVLGIDSVDTKSFDYNTVTSVILQNATYNAIAVEPGAVLIGAWMNTQGSTNYNGFAISIGETNATGQLFVVNMASGGAGGGVNTFTLNFLRP